MSDKTKHSLVSALPILFTILLSLLFGKSVFDITAGNMLSLFPAAVSLQILFVFLLFGLKTLSVFFPLTALYVCCGILFSPWTAILSACGGLVICLSIGYCLGRFTGDSLFAAMQKKYPKMKRLTDYREDNLLLFSFELRLLVFLPGDVLSWYMGTCKIPLCHLPVWLFVGHASWACFAGAAGGHHTGGHFF